jgi:citrate synthase
VKTAVSTTGELGEYRLDIRGYPLPEIIENLTFGEALFLLIKGRLADDKEARMMDVLLNGILDYAAAPTWALARATAGCQPNSFILPAIAGLTSVGPVTVSPQLTCALLNDAYDRMKIEGLSMEEMAKTIVKEYAERKERIPGFGHPLFPLPQGDPRGNKVLEMAEKLGVAGEKTKLYKAIHDEFIKEPKRATTTINIDGTIGCTMADMGFIPLETIAVATISVLAGIVAHVAEVNRSKGGWMAVMEVLTPKWEYVGEPQRHLPADKIRKV